MLNNTIDHEIHMMDPVFLEDLSKVSLLSRVDSKYIGHLDQLPGILAAVRDDYYVLSHQGIRNFSYRTTYLDTAELKFYLAHHNGRTNRYKIRTREYVDSGLVFDEIKFKNNRGTTNKKRIKRTGKEAPLDGVFLEFINREEGLRSCSNLLEAVLDVSYKRITFTDKEFSERITLDFDLRFNNEKGNDLMENVFIMEIKRGHDSKKSPMEKVLQSRKIQKTGISKYCVGMVCTREGIKHNRFKPLIRTLTKINNKKNKEVYSCHSFMEYSA